MNILVIEDDDATRAALADTLRDAGHYVTSAADGDQALKVLIARDPALDLVITDIVMPGMTGIDLIAWIRRQGMTMPVLAISGGGAMSSIYPVDHPPIQTLMFAGAVGATSVLPKPFKPADLIGRVESLRAVR